MAGALAFHKLKNGQKLDEEEYEYLDEYIHELDSLTVYDTTVINNISNLDYFSQKYKYFDLKKVKTRDFYDDFAKYGIRASEYEISFLSDRALLLIHRAKLGFGSDTESSDSALLEYDIFYSDTEGQFHIVSDCDEKTLEKIDKNICIMKSISSDDVTLINELTEETYFLRKYNLNIVKDALSSNVSETVDEIYNQLLKHMMISEETMNEMSLLSCAYFYRIYKMNFLNIPVEKEENISYTEHDIACIYFKIGNDSNLTEDEYSVIDHYFRKMELFNRADLEVYNCIAAMSYFRKKYNYIRDIDLFNSFSEPIMKQVIDCAQDKEISATNLRKLSNYGVTLLINMFELDVENPNVQKTLNVTSVIPREELKSSISNKPLIDSNHENSIVVYDIFSNAARSCLNNKHAITMEKIKCRRKVSSSEIVLNTYFCTKCNTHYIQSTKYKPYKDYVFPLNVVLFLNDSSRIKEENNKTNIQKESIKPICLEDFLVRSSLLKCVNRSHTLSRIKASVSILTPKQGMIEETIDANYCKECNKSYILESTYNRLKSLGHICCKVIEYEDLAQNYSVFSSWAKKSLLAMYGYNVNKQQALTEAKRHKILDILIQNKVMSSYEIISHLEMLIRTRKNMKNMSDAREKWEDDIDYVQHYNKVDDSVKVKSIYAKRKI